MAQTISPIIKACKRKLGPIFLNLATDGGTCLGRVLGGPPGVTTAPVAAPVHDILTPDWSSKLRTFNYEPLASASIGQVGSAEKVALCMLKGSPIVKFEH
jgi:hypothetical protein